MNKHMIFFPVILASAVSLHVTSYIIEEPPEIVQNPPIQQNKEIDNNKIAVVNNNTDQNQNNVKENNDSQKNENIPQDNNKVETTDNTKQQESEKSVKQETNVVVTPEQNKEEKTEKQVNNQESPVNDNKQNNEAKQQKIPKTEVIEKDKQKDEIKLASAFIPSKPYDDIVREAKIKGGRLDPFLSVKPPDIPSLPEIPRDVPNDNFPDTSFDNSNAFNKPKNNQKPNFKTDNIPEPPVTSNQNQWIPDFNENSMDTNTNNKGNSNSNNTVAKKPQDRIYFGSDANISEGLTLTGIITGSKPLALIKVGEESKVFSVGEEVKPGIKLVEINFERQNVILANNRAKAQLEINE